MRVSKSVATAVNPLRESDRLLSSVLPWPRYAGFASGGGPAARALAPTSSSVRPQSASHENARIDAWASSFDDHAAGYAAARPGYPTELYEVLVERCGLGADSHVIEIGAGPGQATADLIALGATVHAVEPGERLAGQLRDACPSSRLTISQTTFEDAKLDTNSADLVASATAFHWVDESLAWPKIASVLRPGGWVAIWWNRFYDPEGPDDFSRATQPLYESLPDRESSSVNRAGDSDYWLDAIRGAGFEASERRDFAWTWTHTTDDLVALYATFSGTLVRPTDERRRFLDGIRRIADDDFGGVIPRQYVTILYSARKPGAPL